VSKNAADYGLEELTPDPPLAFDSVELEAPTSVALAAAAVDSPVSELRDLNPALLKGVAPAGYRLHLPKGTLDQLEEAFAVIPANMRASWRVQRLASGDTFSSLARRYGGTAENLASANRDSLPEVGRFVAIPVAYPGDRAPARQSTHMNAGKRGSVVGQKKASSSAQSKGSSFAQAAPSKISASGKSPAAAQNATTQKTTAKSPPRRVPGA
jgi:LysM repeat protein